MAAVAEGWITGKGSVTSPIPVLFHLGFESLFWVLKNNSPALFGVTSSVQDGNAVIRVTAVPMDTELAFMAGSQRSVCPHQDITQPTGTVLHVGRMGTAW